MTARAYQARQAVGLLDPGGVADRVVATADGLTMGLTQLSTAMLTAPSVVSGRTVTKLVAASNASAAIKAAADYVCDGTADEVEINAALAALGSVGGTVQLSEGTFTLAAQVLTTAANQIIRGMGMTATILLAAPTVWITLNTYMLGIMHDGCGIIDLTIDGNKTNNASANNFRCLNTHGTVLLQRLLLQRVRFTNSPWLGLVIGGGLVANGIVRDCLFDGATSHGAYVRGGAGQPTVISGCTSKSNGGVGFVADSGPVVLSNCHALSNTSDGFLVSTGFPASLSHCTAQSNGAYGFNVSGADASFLGCMAWSNTSGGFNTSGARARHVGCLARGNVSDGFLAAAAATDTLYVGCQAVDSQTPYGFRSSSNGRVVYIGCQAVGITTYGFYVSAGTASILDCSVNGTPTSSVGIGLVAGTDHQVDGCRITNNGGQGIEVSWTGQRNLALTNNAISDSSLLSNLALSHITLATGVNDSYIAGNSFEMAASGNRAPYCVALASGTLNTYLGPNDYTNGAVTAPVSDGAVSNNTRRPVKIQLDYRANTDIYSNNGLAANTWTDVGPTQSFRVDSATSLIEIAFGGFMMVGNAGVGASTRSRFVLDGSVNRQQGAEICETTSYQNPFSGGHVTKYQGLTVGTHTLKVQVQCNQAATMYLRGSSWPESLNVVVKEHQR